MIGILGGTFDPIHLGHLHIASQVDSKLGLDQLQFMPCALPVHRHEPRASAVQRCEMIELAIAGRDRFRLNPVEIERRGPSYTVDSLRQIRQQSDSRLVLVLGGDAFNGFASWKQPQQVLDLANLVVCLRPGVETDRQLFYQQRVDSVQALRQSHAGAILMLEVDAIDCSSSAVRCALDAGNLPRQWLSPAVADYIESNQLYRRTGD